MAKKNVGLLVYDGQWTVFNPDYHNMVPGSLIITSGTSYPTSPSEGQIFYRTDLGKLYYYNGTSWAEVASTSGSYLAINGTNSPTADIDWGGYKLTNLGTPANDHDAANKLYVDGKVSTLYWKDPVIDYQSAPPGVASDGDRYLVKTPGSGVWTGYDERIAVYESSTATWSFIIPTEGYAVFNKADNTIYTYNGSSWSQVSGGGATGSYLALNGSNSPTSDIDWGAHHITNLADPVNNQDATTKQYVDNGFLKLDGTNYPSADISMNNHAITDLNNPTNNQDAMTLGYANAAYIRTDGSSTITTDIPWSNKAITDLKDPTNAQDAATKNYVDSSINSLTWQAPVKAYQANPPGTPVDGDRYIVKTAGSGAWTSHDEEIAVYSGGVWTFTVPTEGFAAYIQADDAIYTYNGSVWGTISFAGYLKTDGTNSPSADISWDNNKLTDLGAPTSDNDAVNKYYVDVKFRELNWQDSVKDKDIADPTTLTPSSGDRYIVASGGSGAWTGHDGEVAEYDGSVWNFATPTEGFVVWVEDENKLYLHDGTNWGEFNSFVDHNSLNNLQGGTSGEYYHLTQAQYDTLTDGSVADTLHIHTLDKLDDTSLSSPSSDEILTFDGSNWKNSLIVNANVDASAAIAWSKLDKTGSKVEDLDDVPTASGGTAGYLKTDGSGTLTWDELTKSDVTDFTESDYVHVTGDETVNGIKTFGSIPVLPGSDPTADNEAARKAYVDTQITSVGDTRYLKLDATNAPITGDLQMGDGTTNHNITNVKDPVNAQDAATKNYVDSNYLALDGSTLPSADISWNFHKITNLTDPTSNQDAATKSYVDALVHGLDWQNSVLDKDVTDPSTLTPSSGDRYIVAASAVGDWAGHDNEIAEYDGSAWQFTTPNEGFAVWVEDEDINYTYNGTTWAKFGSTITHNNTNGLQGGTSGEYYHLTQAQHDTLTDGSIADTLHIHTLDKLDDVGLASPLQDKYALIYDGTGSKWGSRFLVKADISDYTESDYVHVTGDETVNGIKTFGSIPVLPGSDPTADNEAARKKYVDDSITNLNLATTYLKLDASNGPMSGDLQMGDGTTNYKIENLADPVNLQDAVTRNYLNNNVLLLNGGNVPTSNISWGSHSITDLLDPTNAQDAATKNYVDTEITNLNLATTYLKLDGTNAPMTGNLAMGDGTTNYKITNLASPTDANDAATKAYVDAQVGGTGYLAIDGSNSPTADISWGNYAITDLKDPVNVQDAATKNYIDNHALFIDGSTVPTANIDWNGFKITGLGTPSASTDAATKEYVDQIKWKNPVEDKDVTDPSTLTPSSGDRYIVASGAVGDWAGHDNDIAEYDGVAWQFETPDEGYATYVKDEDKIYNFDGTSWGTSASGSISNLDDLSDVDTTGAVTDNVLKYDGTNWVDGLITNDSVSSTAAIAWSKLDKTGSKVEDLDDVPTAASGTAGYLKTDGAGNLTWDQLTKVDIVGFNETDYVHTSGDEVVSGVKSFNDIPVLPGSDPTSDNEATRKAYVDSEIEDAIDNLVWRNPVLDRDVTDPSTLTPSSGDRYIVAASAVGDWLGHDNEIAEYDGSVWQFTTGLEGYALYVKDEDKIVTFDGSSWNELAGGSSVTNISDLSDVDTTGAVANNALLFDGTNWVDGLITNDNIDASAAIAWSKIDNIFVDITKLEVYSVAIFDDEVSFQTNYLRLNYNDASSGQTYFGLEVDRGIDPTVYLVWDDVNGKWSFTNDGTTYEAIPTSQYLTDNYLRLDGTNSPEADIDMNSHKIINVNDPTNAQDAATKNYVDTQIFGISFDSTYLKLDGSNAPMTGDLAMGDGTTNYKITNLADPVNANDAANKDYVDTEITNLNLATTYLKLDGTNSPSTDINWNSNTIINLKDPINAQDAATKHYVDLAITGLDWQNSVKDKDISDPSTLTPADGDRYIVASGALGDWVTHDNDIAEYDGSAWQFTTPNEGFAVWVEDEDKQYTYDGTSWVVFSAGVSDHNSLSGLQGGTSGEYYHLTSSEYLEVQSLGTTYLKLDGTNSPTANIDWNNKQIQHVDALTLGATGSTALTYDMWSFAGQRFYLNSQDSDSTGYGAYFIFYVDDEFGNEYQLLFDPSKRWAVKDSDNTTESGVLTDNTGLRLDGTNSPSADISWNSKKITNLADPVNAQDAATKAYVDANIGSGGSTSNVWVDPVEDKDVTDPTTLSPSSGDRYIVASGATGDWLGHDDDIAEYDGSAWQFTTPDEGVVVYIKDENLVYKFDGSNWSDISTVAVDLPHIVGNTFMVGLATLTHTISNYDATATYTITSLSSGISCSISGDTITIQSTTDPASKTTMSYILDVAKTGYMMNSIQKDIVVSPQAISTGETTTVYTVNSDNYSTEVVSTYGGTVS